MCHRILTPLVLALWLLTAGKSNGSNRRHQQIMGISTLSGHFRILSPKTVSGHLVQNNFPFIKYSRDFIFPEKCKCFLFLLILTVSFLRPFNSTTLVRMLARSRSRRHSSVSHRQTTDRRNAQATLFESTNYAIRSPFRYVIQISAEFTVCGAVFTRRLRQ